MLNIAITGHRPEQLGDVEWVREALNEVFETMKPDRIYQGMAAGVDLLSARVAYHAGIPFVACRPWAGHTPRVEDKKIYDTALEKAEEVVNVSESEDYVGPWLYHKRNEYMVDHADYVVAVWNGSTKGGTAACVNYAKKKKVPIVQINPVTQEIIYPQQLKVEEDNASVNDETTLF